MKAIICKLGARLLVLAFGFNLLSPLRAEEASVSKTAKSTTASTNAAGPAELKPAPDAGRIAYVTARMLEGYQYLRRPLDSTLSTRFFDAYLNSLDSQHLHFLQSDLAEFAVYRTNLNRLTIKRSGTADTQPAYEIFERYLDRFRQHVAYVDELLKTEKFDFTSNDRIPANRHEMPYPKDINEAQQIWREQLRYQYLMEKINRETRKTNASPTSAMNGFSNNAAGTISPPSPPRSGDLSRLGSGERNVGEATGPRGPSERERASQQGRGEEALRVQGQGEPVVTNAVSEKPGPPKTTHEEIVEALSKNYHRLLHVFEDYDGRDVLNAYLDGLARAYDPHSDYQGPMDYEDFAMQMNLSLQGIGAVLRSEDGYCKIEELMNGPAKASKKIKVDDRIVAVAQSNQPPVEIFEMPINKAVRLIRGPKGTEVRLTIIPAGAPDSTREVVTLIRDEIKLENGEAKGKIIEEPDAQGKTVRLGVIDLPSFYATIDAQGNPTPKSTTADVAAILKKFREEKVAGVVLDLRHNGGGALEEAIRLAGLFIKEGPIVQIKHWDGQIDVREDTDPSVAFTGPLILLTSRFSASASEIVAGALQDYGRALIVGDKSTFGKGTAQQLFDLSKIPALTEVAHPGELKLTNSKFYRASGASTELRGVAADIVLPSLWNDSTEVGENTLDNHLPWDTIESSTYEKVNMVQPELEELAKRSSERTATNKEFAYLQEDIARVQKQREDKTVSLNEKEELDDRAKVISLHLTREQERASRKLAQPTVYDLTVTQAGQSGLPSVTPHTNDLSGLAGVASTETELLPRSHNDRDEFGDAARSETEHAEAARLVEAEHILLDYISLLKQAPANPNAPLLAK